MPAKAKAVASAAVAAAPARLPLFWAPTAVLLAIPLWEIANSLLEHNYPQRLFWVHHELMNGLSAVCFIVAGVGAALPAFRLALERHLDGLGAMPRGVRLAWLVCGYLGMLTWFCFLRYAQYRSYQLPQDTTISLSEAYTFLHHGSLFISIFGVHQMSIHVFLLMPLLAPILLIWNSPIPLLFAQNAAICAAPFAAYSLIALGTGSSFAGLIGMLLLIAHPLTFELLTSSLCYAPLVALLPWAMYFLERRRWLPAAALLLLMNAFPEQVPFIFFGLGLTLCAWPWDLRLAPYSRDEAPLAQAGIELGLGADRKRWIAFGGLLCVAAVLLWIGERSLIAHNSRTEAVKDFAGSTYWLMFKDLVPAQTPYDRIFSEIVSHPLRTIGRLFSSIYRYYPMLRLLFATAFLPLLSPATLIVVICSALPNILAASTSAVPFLVYHPIGYSDFGLHQASYVFGPMAWAAALGIRRAYLWLAKRGWANWLLVWALFFAGFGFKYSHRTLMPRWRPWFDTLPPVLAAVPPKARLWADEYATPPLAMRRWIKITQWGPTDPNGYERLFMPDYVLLDKAFVFQAKPPYRDKMLTFLERNHFRKVAESGGLVLLKNPSPAPDPEADVTEWFQLPAPDFGAAKSFADYLVNGPISPS